MSIFTDVKAAVSTREAAERYGLQVNRNGMALCPFHDDHNPSLKVDQRFHCFGCQADGDVIDFAARLFNLSLKNAALLLAHDFAIPTDPYTLFTPAPRGPSPAEIRAQRQKKISYVYNLLVQYAFTLRNQEELYAPKSPDDEFDPHFREALENLAELDYMIELLRTGTEDDQNYIMNTYSERFPNCRSA